MLGKSINDILLDVVKRPIPIISPHQISVSPEPKICITPVYEINKQVIKPKLQKVICDSKRPPRVYCLGQICDCRRIVMKNLGLDLGTRNIVLAFAEEDGTVGYLSEVNGYWPFERVTPFIKNMLDDPAKIRSDGTKRPARWIELDGQAIILGRDAEEFAYAKNDTLKRPMAEGGVAANEEAMVILSTIVTGLLKTAEDDVGKFDEDMRLCYCTTAPAINKNSLNVDYHTRVIEAILDNYKTSSIINKNKIVESHAIVLDSSDDGTGIGISWGAGTVTVSYVKYGMEVFSFCWVGSGDWIDMEVAKRHGYDPENKKNRSKETPTTVSKRKMSIDISPDFVASDRLGIDIQFHYDILINTVIDGIIDGFIKNENEARIEEGINIYMAGGTACPKGFVDSFIKTAGCKKMPFDINNVVLTAEPLFTVARGCLAASKMF